MLDWNQDPAWTSNSDVHAEIASVGDYKLTALAGDGDAAWELFEKEYGRWVMIDWADLDGATLDDAKAAAEAALAEEKQKAGAAFAASARKAGE
jgi:hypothetical protein